jgi:hypothetical protein
MKASRRAMNDFPDHCLLACVLSSVVCRLLFFVRFDKYVGTGLMKLFRFAVICSLPYKHPRTPTPSYMRLLVETGRK